MTVPTDSTNCGGVKLAKLNFNLTQFTYRDGMPINLSYPF